MTEPFWYRAVANCAPARRARERMLIASQLTGQNEGNPEKVNHVHRRMVDSIKYWYTSACTRSSYGSKRQRNLQNLPVCTDKYV